MSEIKNKLWCEKCGKDTEHSHNDFGWVSCDICNFVGMFKSPDGKSIEYRKSVKNIDVKD